MSLGSEVIHPSLGSTGIGASSTNRNGHVIGEERAPQDVEDGEDAQRENGDGRQNGEHQCHSFCDGMRYLEGIVDGRNGRAGHRKRVGPPSQRESEWVEADQQKRAL